MKIKIRKRIKSRIKIKSMTQSAVYTLTLNLALSLNPLPNPNLALNLSLLILFAPCPSHAGSDPSRFLDAVVRGPRPGGCSMGGRLTPAQRSMISMAAHTTATRRWPWLSCAIDRLAKVDGYTVSRRHFCSMRPCVRREQSWRLQSVNRNDLH